MKTKTKRSRSRNYATYEEIAQELRDAKEHAAALMTHEQTATRAMEADGDQGVVTEAERLFMRDFKAYLGAVRSAREYLQAAANKSRHDRWYEGRLVAPASAHLFEFFRLLINQSLHQYRPRLVPLSNQVQVIGEPDSVLVRGPGGLMPNKMRVVGVVGAKYSFRLDGLEHDTERAYETVQQRHPGEGVVPLALRYVDELEQIFKNAKRNGRFDAIQPQRLTAR